MTATYEDTYRIVGKLGDGGMSSVFRVKHKTLGTDWAMKRVAKEQGGSRFNYLAEVDILKRLRHPMLVKIANIYEDADYIYIVEDLVVGESLAAVLDENKKNGRRIDEATATRWFFDLCNVLNYLHKQNPPIIYRDLKPSNIMLEPEGTLKLIDFGIAREYKETSNRDTNYIGTQGYAAPEQFGKSQSDARTDIYSLGVTMYHIFTGKSPYDPPYQFVPARQLAPELSVGVERVLGRCVMPEPADRYQSIDELLSDLMNRHRYDASYQKAVRTIRVRRAVVGVMLAGSLALIGLGWQRMGREKESAYTQLLAQANELYASDYEAASALLDQAAAIFPERIDAARQKTYALHENYRWQECVDYGASVLEAYGMDTQVRLIMASAQFELGLYEEAARGFAQGGELSADNLRDYAVCLGRMGEIDRAQEILEQLRSKRTANAVTEYVYGELLLAQKAYPEAEAAFSEALSAAEADGNTAILRRCYRSFARLYHEGNTIDNAERKAIDLLSAAVRQEGMQSDPYLWRMLAEAYGAAAQKAQRTGDSEQLRSNLSGAIEAYDRAMDLGAKEPAVYESACYVCIELKDFAYAEEIADRYAEWYPNSYVSHALRGLILIAGEQEKPEASREFSAALAEYEAAGEMLRSSDDPGLYQQLTDAVESLRIGGWL